LRQMVEWAFAPADEKFVQYFIEKGKTDAVEWMNHMGLGKESRLVEEKVEGHVEDSNVCGEDNSTTTLLSSTTSSKETQVK
jgi:hypothetical protein